jgi:hypothetical protein
VPEDVAASADADADVDVGVDDGREGEAEAEEEAMAEGRTCLRVGARATDGGVAADIAGEGADA